MDDLDSALFGTRICPPQFRGPLPGIFDGVLKCSALCFGKGLVVCHGLPFSTGGHLFDVRASAQELLHIPDRHVLNIRSLELHRIPARSEIFELALEVGHVAHVPLRSERPHPALCPLGRPTHMIHGICPCLADPEELFQRRSETIHVRISQIPRTGHHLFHQISQTTKCHGPRHVGCRHGRGKDDLRLYQLAVRDARKRLVKRLVNAGRGGRVGRHVQHLPNRPHVVPEHDHHSVHTLAIGDRNEVPACLHRPKHLVLQFKCLVLPPRFSDLCTPFPERTRRRRLPFRPFRLALHVLLLVFLVLLARDDAAVDSCLCATVRSRTPPTSTRTLELFRMDGGDAITVCQRVRLPQPRLAPVHLERANRCHQKSKVRRVDCIGMQKGRVIGPQRRIPPVLAGNEVAYKVLQNSRIVRQNREKVFVGSANAHAPRESNTQSITMRLGV